MENDSMSYLHQQIVTISTISFSKTKQIPLFRFKYGIKAENNGNAAISFEQSKWKVDCDQQVINHEITSVTSQSQW